MSVFDRVKKNILGKGENAGYQHFILFPQCFEKASFPDTSIGVTVRGWVIPLSRSQSLLDCNRTILISRIFLFTQTFLPL